MHLLTSIATGTGPAFAKRDALRRIDELREVHPLSAREAERLASCLNDKDLVAATLVVLDEFRLRLVRLLRRQHRERPVRRAVPKHERP